MDSYFEGGRDYNVPEMIEPVENGVIRNADGVVLATFASSAHALVSLYLHKFSVEQIKMLIPGIANFDKNMVTKIMHDTCKREVRKDFIKSLRGNLPRQLTNVEYDNIVNYVGTPNGKPKGTNVEEMTEGIRLDIENVDFIVPTKVTKKLTDADIREKIEKNNQKLEKQNAKLVKLNEKMAKLNEKEATQQVQYKKVKMNKSIRLVETAIADIKAKNEKLQSKISENVEPVAENSEN
jgi:hypothetical protein